ncbi:MAG: hypothetical protein KBT84_00190 [Pseudomonas sp.]|nr:hypothetical protein [Pseudomonas sp.]
MPTFRLLTAALAISVLGMAAPALADEHAAEHAQDSNTEAEIGGSAQVPNTREGAETTNPYDDVGLDEMGDEISDEMNTDEDAIQDDDQPINE